MTARVFLALLLPLLGSTEYIPKALQPTDCSEITIYHQQVSGVYTIYPTKDNPVEVYCSMCCDDMQTNLGKWTVIQRRMDGSVNFYRPWDQYKKGFGNKYGEYWLGLETLYQLTQKKKYELRVDLQDFEGGKAFARYSYFSVDSEANGYKLHIGGFTDGGAGNSLDLHNGMVFSTFDNDPMGHNCAKTYLGGFWYAICHHANPNGIYLWGMYKNYYGIGNVWYHWKGHEYGLKSIIMKIRPVSYTV